MSFDRWGTKVGHLEVISSKRPLAPSRRISSNNTDTLEINSRVYLCTGGESPGVMPQRASTRGEYVALRASSSPVGGEGTLALQYALAPLRAKKEAQGLSKCVLPKSQGEFQASQGFCYFLWSVSRNSSNSSPGSSGSTVVCRFSEISTKTRPGNCTRARGASQSSSGMIHWCGKSHVDPLAPLDEALA